MTTIAPITESNIKHLSNEQSFQRGVNYYRSGALFDLVRQGNELRAYCEGSSYEAYRISAKLGSKVLSLCIVPVRMIGAEFASIVSLCF